MFDKFKRVGDQRILVIGDIILDKYIHGQTTRISPEAPVPIVLSDKKTFKLGGAANVAANLNALGAKSTLIGCIGNDDNGKIIKQLISQTLEDTAGIFETTKTTTTKTRIISKGQQVLRIDEEDTSFLSLDDEENLFALINKLIHSSSFNGIILQDYNKGIFTKSLISRILNIAEANKTPVFVDPKHKNFWNYKGATIFKPNLSEIIKANNNDESHSLDDLLKSTYKRLNCKILMCTLADEGIVYVENEKIVYSPTQKVDVVDVSGAGDSALSIIVLTYLLGYDTKAISIWANLCGKIACMKSGVSTVSIDEILSAYRADYTAIDK